MICYKCGSPIGSGKKCLHCGADVSVYRKIIRTSNAFYNSGLEKARIRDLSGALFDLTRSLEYDKNNTRARNLLGLVYFEMGEVVDAISHWVISKDYQPLDNIAEKYIEEVQGNQKEYEEMGLAIKKYNQSIEAAKNDGEDMAIIQLKSAIKSNPRHIRSYQLLTLLLIKEGEFSKANKVIKKGLQIDKGNTLLLEYALEIKGKMGRPLSKQSALLEKTIEKAKEDVIVPKYKEDSGFKKVVVSVGATLIVCLLAYFFLIRPSTQSEIASIKNQNQIIYNEKAEDKDIEIQALTEELNEYKANAEEIDKYTGEDGIIANYERLIEAINYYFNEDYSNMAASYAQITPDVVTSDTFKSAYNKLGTLMSSDAALDAMAASAWELYEKGSYDECIKICDKCLALNANYARAIYYKGLAYEGKGDTANAKIYLQEVVDKYPDTTFADYAAYHLSSL